LKVELDPNATLRGVADPGSGALGEDAIWEQLGSRESRKLAEKFAGENCGRKFPPEVCPSSPELPPEARRSDAVPNSCGPTTTSRFSQRRTPLKDLALFGFVQQIIGLEIICRDISLRGRSL
jgi:hypothetical protein